MLSACRYTDDQVQIVATTAPVYHFTKAICNDTDLQVEQLITENVPCLHDYTLQSNQMHMIEGAEVVIISGLGLEEFLYDPLASANTVVDSSAGIQPICNDHHLVDDHSHHHGEDPHIWLDPENAAIMAENIYHALCSKYPEQADIFHTNYLKLTREFDALSIYAQENLSQLLNRNIITFHDGFSYMAKAYNLEILHAVEEESGSEASAAELIEICDLLKAHRLSAIFTEENGSDSAAKIISKETNAKIYTLDMAMSGDYFDAMYHNINTLKEALE